MREQPTIPVVLTESRARGENLVYHSNSQAKEQSYPTSAPPPLSRLWERTERIYPNRGQTFFPDAPAGAVYDVTIRGTISYRANFRSESSEQWDPGITVKGEADAMYMTTRPPGWPYLGDSYCYDHAWFRINGQAVTEERLLDQNGRRDPWGLKANRSDHIYRLRVENIRETLCMACESEAGLRQFTCYKRDSFGPGGFFGGFSFFTVSVTAWAPASRAIAQSIARAAEPTAEERHQRKIGEHLEKLRFRAAIKKGEQELEQDIEADIARRYAHLPADERRRKLKTILDYLNEEDDQNDETL